jgi:nitroreductase
LRFYDLALARRSVRAFLPDPVLDSDREKMLAAAISAPSACDSQNWHWVCLCTRESIEGLASAVAEGVKRAVRTYVEDEAYLTACVRRNTFFRSAPMVVAVYLEPMTYADARLTAALRESHVGYEEQMRMLMQPDLLSIGAAIENLLLCAQDLGYGGCWMNGPVLAAREIDAYLGQCPPRRLVSLVPIGRPAKAPGKKTIRGNTIEYR